MYKAETNIGDYKKGDIVPDKIAEIWEKMYVESPVKKVEDLLSEIKSPTPEKKEDSSDAMLDDYLDRSQATVIKALKSDSLSENILKKLLAIEKKDKKRYKVLSAIKSILGDWRK